MGKAGQSEAETSRHLPKRNIYALGVLAILGSEFLLRNVLLPKQANSLHVGAALIVEWLVLVVLLAFWIPRFELPAFSPKRRQQNGCQCWAIVTQNL
jgi:hypothetical protein